MATGDGPLVRLDREGGVAVLTIDHPPVNVLSAAVLDALLARLDEVDADPSVRVVMLESAAEKAFAAGADIREMATLDPAGAYRHGRRGQEVTRRIERLAVPVIAAVHGVCLGGGCEVALACDLIVASEDAVFGQPEIRLGVMPGWGGTQRLPRRIGTARAREWILTGRNASAHEARDAGWVLDVVPRAELRGRSRALATTLAQQAPVALAAAKYALARASERELESDLDFELDLWSRLFGTSDQKEGMAAFLGKRPWSPTGQAHGPGAPDGFPWTDPAPPGVSTSAGGKRKS